MPLNDVPPDPASSTHAPDVARERAGSDGAEPERAEPKRAGRARRRAVRLGIGDATPSRSVDDADRGWHESAGDRTNDEQLRRDVPPHW